MSKIVLPLPPEWESDLHKLTATGLVANKTLTAEQWEDAGNVLGHIEQRLSWYLGDWITSRHEKWEQ